ALQLVNAVDTRTAKVGDYVYLHTASPVAAGGHIVVPVGSYVQATVSRAQRSGRVSGRAELAIRIETLTFPDGKEIRINPHLSSVDSAGSGQRVDAGEGDIKQASGHDADAERAGVGLAVVLLTRGKEVELRQGATVDVVFDRAVPLD
ncbi:MAG: hypothetical protein ABSH37_24340, partial [Bryobacteraceae bacterium]